MRRRARLAALARLIAERLPHLDEVHAELVADARLLLADVAALRRAAPRQRVAVHWLCASEQAAERVERIAVEVALAGVARTPLARQKKPRVVVFGALLALADRL